MVTNNPAHLDPLPQHLQGSAELKQAALISGMNVSYAANQAP